jgi:hypothetical protein
MVRRAWPDDVWLVCCGDVGSDQEGSHEWRQLGHESVPVSKLVPPPGFRAALAMANHEALKISCPFCGQKLEMR